jgi:hypothetical protein
MIADEIGEVIKQGVPFCGVCLYPIIDRPDWDHFNVPWHNAGLWDAEVSEDKLPTRDLYLPYAEALLKAQNKLAVLFKQKLFKRA